MKIKESASLAGLDPRVRPILILADDIWTVLGQELVVTSGLDGSHSAGSLHYYGLAVDLRTRYFTVAQAKKAAERLKAQLARVDRDDGKYTVLLEQTHIHAHFLPNDLPGV